MKSVRGCLGVAVAGVMLAGWWGGGCVSTDRRMLDETTTIFHDDLRWGRLLSAQGVVDGRMRRAFAEHHRGWGTDIHVVDVEPVHVSQSSDSGVARLRVSWTRGYDATDLRQSVVEERWECQQGTWRLRNESVVAGDEGLFGTPTREGATARADLPEHTRP